MQTRLKTGAIKPKAYNSVHTASSLLEPKSVQAALGDAKWSKAMFEEYTALMQNKTWSLVPSSNDMNILGNKWVFRTKYHPDGSVSKFKARLVVNGFHQTPSLDFFDTYSPVIKASTIRVIFTLAVTYSWDIQQMDINNAFLNGEFQETAYMEQPAVGSYLLMLFVYVDDILITVNLVQLLSVLAPSYPYMMVNYSRIPFYIEVLLVLSNT
ncbi:hypothetical protein ACOSP7_005300 [Xanthoceras sorbifolium]